MSSLSDSDTSPSETVFTLQWVHSVFCELTRGGIRWRTHIRGSENRSPLFLHRTKTEHMATGSLLRCSLVYSSLLQIYHRYRCSHGVSSFSSFYQLLATRIGSQPASYIPDNPMDHQASEQLGSGRTERRTTHTRDRYQHDEEKTYFAHNYVIRSANECTSHLRTPASP